VRKATEMDQFTQRCRGNHDCCVTQGQRSEEKMLFSDNTASLTPAGACWCPWLSSAWLGRASAFTAHHCCIHACLVRRDEEKTTVPREKSRENAQAGQKPISPTNNLFTKQFIKALHYQFSKAPHCFFSP